MEEIKRLIEKRQVEATLKQLTPKLMLIAQRLGQPVVGGGDLQTSLYDMAGTADPDEMPTGDGDSAEIGLIYDALAFGHNLEVRYLNHSRELRASYNGYTVYHEVEGELQCYVPHASWEEVVNYLHGIAKKRDEMYKATHKEERQQGLIKDAQRFLQKLREQWGI